MNILLEVLLVHIVLPLSEMSALYQELIILPPMKQMLNLIIKKGQHEKLKDALRVR